MLCRAKRAMYNCPKGEDMFVIIEGPNGAGKTTLINSLKKRGYKTLSSPNGTPLAQLLRPAARGAEPWTDIDPKVQFMLFSAARYDEYVRLVHQSDDIIFADRWWTSTYVYQCKLQGISVDFMEHTIHPEEKIDLVITLDAQNEILIERVLNERKENPSHGTCRWTTDKKQIEVMAYLYRKELPDYLNGKGIRHISIDTSCMKQDDVLNKVVEYATDGVKVS